MFQLPGLVGWIVGIGFFLLQQVPDTPSDDITRSRLNVALVTFQGFFQDVGNGPPQAGLFGDKQSHAKQSGRQWLEYCFFIQQIPLFGECCRIFPVPAFPYQPRYKRLLLFFHRLLDIELSCCTSAITGSSSSGESICTASRSVPSS